MRRKHISLILVTALTFLKASRAGPLSSKFEDGATSSSFLDVTSTSLDSVSFQIEPSSTFLEVQSSAMFSNRFATEDVDGGHISSFLNEVNLEPTSSSQFLHESSSYPVVPNDILQPLVVQLAESMLSDLNSRIDSSILSEASSPLDAMSSSSILISNTIDDEDNWQLSPQFYSNAALQSVTPDPSEGLRVSSPVLLKDSRSSSFQFDMSSTFYPQSIRYSALSSETPELPDESHSSFQTIASALLLQDVSSVLSDNQHDDPSSTEVNNLLKFSSATSDILSSSIQTLQTPELPEVPSIPFELVASALLQKGTSPDQTIDLSSTSFPHSLKFSSSLHKIHSSLFKTLLKSQPPSSTLKLPAISNLPLQAIASALLLKDSEQFDEFKSTNLHPSLTRTFRPSALRITPSPKPTLASSATSFKHSDASIASSFFNAVLSSISPSHAITESPLSPLLTALDDPVSSMMSQLQPEPSSKILLPHMQSMLYSAALLRSSIIKNTPAISDFIQPTPSLSPTTSSSLEPETEQETNYLTSAETSNSAATVDKIIEGLMNIIRPLNSQNQPQQTTLLPSKLTIPESRPISTDQYHAASSSQLLQSLQKFYLTPSVDHRTASKSHIKLQIIPSSATFDVLPSRDGIPSSEQFDLSVIHAILHQQEQDDRTTTEDVDNDVGTQGQRPEFSHFDKPEVATLNSRPSSSLASSTPSFSQHKPAIATPIFNTRPWKRPSTRGSTRHTTTTTTSTTKRPSILAFGEARPIVLDLFDNDSSDVLNSRLPSTGFSPLEQESHTGHIEANIGSNVLKIKEKIPTLRPPTRKPSLQFISSQFNFDELVSATSERPSAPLVRPSHQVSAQTIPPKITTTPLEADEPVEMDHANNQHNVISSQATFFIRPTSASSSVVRQTIFQTVVSISDSTDEFAHFHDEEPEDFPPKNVLATPPSRPSSPSVDLVEHNHDDPSAFASDTSDIVTKIPPIAVVTTRTTTSTARPKTTTTTAKTTTTTTTKRTTTTSSRTTTTKKPTSTRRPALRPLRTTTRRPIRRTTTKRPIADAPTIMVTRRPFRPGQTLLNFGYSLIPAAVIATIIGLPLVVAGKKKRDVGPENDFVKTLSDIKAFVEDMPEPEIAQKTKAFRRRSTKNMKYKGR